MSELDRHIDELLKFLKRGNKSIPEYSIIKIVEFKNIHLENTNWTLEEVMSGEYDTKVREVVKKSAFIDKDDFIEEFDKLLDKGYPWIDLNCAGVLGDVLIFTVRVPGYTSGVPREHVNVNYSGPRIIDEKIVWDLSGLYKII